MTEHTICYVLAVDPGKSTGLALIKLKRGPVAVDRGRFAMFTPELLMTRCSEMSRFVHDVRLLLASARKDTPLVVSCEKFIVTQRTCQTQDTQAIEVTGALWATLEMERREHTWAQFKPSDAKPHWPNKVIRELGLDIAGTTDHEQDAIRHGLEWCMRYANNKVDF